MNGKKAQIYTQFERERHGDEANDFVNCLAVCILFKIIHMFDHYRTCLHKIFISLFLCSCILYIELHRITYECHKLDIFRNAQIFRLICERERENVCVCVCAYTLFHFRQQIQLYIHVNVDVGQMIKIHIPSRT